MAAIPMKKWSTLRQVLFSIQTFKWSAHIYAAEVVFLASRILYGITGFRRNGATRFVLFAQFAEGSETKRTENETGGKDEKTVSSGD
jgi:hypothetical protein